MDLAMRPPLLPPIYGLAERRGKTGVALFTAFLLNLSTCRWTTLLNQCQNFFLEQFGHLS
jgi:hypothetical protein